MASIAFLLGRRAPTRRFTYGFGSAEDVAGVIVVLVIAASAVAAGVQSVRRLADPIVGRDPHATHVPRSSRSSAPA